MFYYFFAEVYMDSTMIVGNLTHDPNIHVFDDSGTSVVRFTIAVNRYFKKKNGEQGKDTTFYPCEAWDKGAEYIAEHASKGSLMEVKGSMKNHSYETKDGTQVKEMRLRVTEFNLLDRRGRKNDSETNEQEPVEVGSESGDESGAPF